MLVIADPSEMQKYSLKARSDGKTIGLVPTMGYLHEGHLSLVREARKGNDLVVVSIFVNPTQFGPGEDLEKYPRDFARDKKLCDEAGVDVIFSPDRESVYPKDFSTRVEETGLSQRLCGLSRPGHFAGVATIVLKLFNIVQPSSAYFGQKDAQQVLIIKRMVRDLSVPVKIKVCPTVREPDGLAVSSRNSYLGAGEHENALAIYRGLIAAKKMIDDGERDSGLLKNKMRSIIGPEVSRIDYVSIVDVETLEDVEKLKGEVLLAVAAFVGNTRLIDNIQLKVP